MRNLWKLTPAEERVLYYWLKGYTEKEISKILNIQTCTIHSHVGNIYDKKGVNSRKELRKVMLND